MRRLALVLAVACAAVSGAAACGGGGAAPEPRVPWPTPQAAESAAALARARIARHVTRRPRRPHHPRDVILRVDTSRVVPGLVYYRAFTWTTSHGGPWVTVAARDTLVVPLTYTDWWRRATRGWTPADDGEMVAACFEARAIRDQEVIVGTAHVVPGPELADTLTGAYGNKRRSLRRFLHAPIVRALPDAAWEAEFWVMGHVEASRFHCRIDRETIRVRSTQEVRDVRLERWETIRSVDWDTLEG